MQAARKVSGWTYGSLRFLWRILPLSWRDRIRRACYGRDPLQAGSELAARTWHATWRMVPYPWRRRVHRVFHRGLTDDARRQIHADLRRAYESATAPSVVVLPLLSWFECGFQRPHQMARALAAEGCSVIFYEPWTIGSGGQSDLALSDDAAQQRDFVGLRTISERLHLLRVPHWFLSECLVETPPDALIMLWPYQARFIPRESRSAVVYEIVDDQDLLTAARWWRRAHQRWVREADVITVTAESLLERVRHDRPDVLRLPNGVWLDDWRSCPSGPVPDDLRAAREAKVVVAYYGALAQWFDWGLWEAAAASRPDWAFVLIGFPFGMDEQQLIEQVSRLPNVHYLGPKPHAELPRYMAHVDVATIPFRLNAITHACSPLKLFEYMAAGKPIVATEMHEILKYRSVLFASSPQTLVAKIEEAVSKKDDPKYLSLLAAEAQANTWRTRATLLRDAIQAACDRCRSGVSEGAKR